METFVVGPMEWTGFDMRRSRGCDVCLCGTNTDDLIAIVIFDFSASDTFSSHSFTQFMR